MTWPADLRHKRESTSLCGCRRGFRTSPRFPAFLANAATPDGVDRQRKIVETFISWNQRHRAPATVAFHRARLKKFCEAYNARELDSLTPLEIDEHLALAGTGMSDSTRHHDVVALERLQKFAIEHELLDKPVFGNLEKPRVGRRDRVPTAAETEAILAKASPEFRLIYSALRQCGARPGELCRATIADVDRANPCSARVS